MRLVHTLTFRVLVGSSTLLLALFAVYIYLVVRFQSQQLTTLVQDSAGRVSDVVKSSTRHGMMLNRREDVYEIINTIGREVGVEGIRIYNKRGMIMFSTDKSEESKVVNMNGEACYACHDTEKPLQSLPISTRTRIYSWEGHRVIGHINPIRNEPACSDAACHAHPPDRTVLGVLDVRMSLEMVDRRIAGSTRQLVAYCALATLIVMCASGLFLFVSVHRPVKRLTEGVHEISAGNLEYRLLTSTSDELGELSRAFNTMGHSLEKAQEENRSWSENLERRVEEKSEQLRRIHDQMIQIEKMASLGKLAATVAHELNNPLEGILTYAKLINRSLHKAAPDPGSFARIFEDLELIIREVQRCGNIVKNLLLFSKKQVGDVGMRRIQDVVDKAVRLMQHHFNVSAVECRVALPSDDLTLMCDENQIEQALVALFVNAVEAMPKGGTLTVSGGTTGAGNLQLSISDSGLGIPPDDLAHIFEPFFTTKKDGKGVGLGLSAVYGIVERHGGTISVDSGADRGTTFTMIFPPASVSHERVSPNHLRADGGTV
jgi:two-component system, NtrC family, sensor kinase